MSFWRDARFLQAGTRQRATSEDAMSGDAQYLWVSRYAQEARVPGIEHSDICDMLDKFIKFGNFAYLGFLLFICFQVLIGLIASLRSWASHPMCLG